MAAQTQMVAGVVLLMAGGGLFVASRLHVWLAKTGFRPSPAFTPVTPQERAKAERRGAAAIRRFATVGTWIGLALIALGVVVLVA